jgi:hypothetical protein
MNRIIAGLALFLASNALAAQSIDLTPGSEITVNVSDTTTIRCLGTGGDGVTLRYCKCVASYEYNLTLVAYIGGSTTPVNDILESFGDSATCEAALAANPICQVR